MTKSQAFIESIKALGGHAKSAQNLLNQLLINWGNEGRSYHNIQHLNECLIFCEAWGAKLNAHNKACLILSIYFHDSIYIPGQPDNEDKSAQWALTSLGREGVVKAWCEIIHHMVMSTKHADPSKHPIGELEDMLHDIDMQILGSSPTRFADYDVSIAKEYSFIPEEVFKAGREKMMSEFLYQAKMGKLFRTKEGQKLNEQAIVNLKSTLKTSCLN